MLHTAIASLPYSGGGSNLSAGLHEMRVNQFVESNGDRIGVQNIVVVITDGFDRDSSSLAEAALAKAAGIVIFGIGTGGIDPVSLESLSSLPQQNKPSFLLANYQQLRNLVDPTVARICVSSADSDCTDKARTVDCCRQTCGLNEQYVS